MKRGTPSHPKTRLLGRLLGIEPWGAVGVLESLWHFAGQYARRGDIGRHSAQAIADGIGWSGDPADLVAALVDAGWLDRCECHGLRIHDWKDHADQAVNRTKDVMAQGFIECYGRKLETASRSLASVQTLPATGYRQTDTGTGLPADEAPPALPPADRAERAIKASTDGLRSKLYALVSEAVEVDPKHRDPTELMRLFTSYDRQPGRNGEGGGSVRGVVNAALLSHERLERSIADAEGQIAEWRNGTRQAERRA